MPEHSTASPTEVLRTGNCATTDRELFWSEATAPEAIAACQRCPMLEPCQEALGALAVTFEPFTDGRVIAGQYWRWRVERPRISADLPPPLPEDPAQSLELLRQQNLYARLGGGSLSAKIRPVFETLVSTYDTQDEHNFKEVLGDMYMLGWRLLARSLLFYNALQWRTAFSDQPKVFAIADRYFASIIGLNAVGFTDWLHMPGLAIRHGPEYFKELYARYADNPDVTPSGIRQLVVGHDICFPEHAIQDYFGRLQLLRGIYPTMPQWLLRRRAQQHLKTGIAGVDAWRRSYDALRADPANAGREDWLLQAAALQRPAVRRKYLSRMTAFFRLNTLTPIQFDAVGEYGSLHERIAGDSYADPEAYVERDDAKRRILERLAGLTPDERAVIILVFGLETMLDCDAPDEHHLRMLYNTQDLAAYATNVLLPKLRQ